ncbi:MAG TPA: hypothetical protein VGK35_14770 [Actinotalea sp.]|jgi:hypothetical protein
MTTVLHPVGPRPPRVYWLRRLVVIAVVLAAVIGIASLLTKLGDGAAAAGDSATDPTTAATDDTSGVPVACAPTAVTIAVTADARTYSAPNQPVLTVGVTNTGTVACSIDSGEGAREVLVTSGTDRIWSSADCRGETTPNLLLLDPGARQDVTVTWPRVRSAAGCTADLPEPRPGTYQATVTMLGATSTPLAFQLS